MQVMHGSVAEKKEGEKRGRRKERKNDENDASLFECNTSIVSLFLSRSFFFSYHFRFFSSLSQPLSHFYSTL